jgi:hypothetical protein
MRKKLHRGIAVAIVVLAATAATVLPAAPALAETRGCRIPPRWISCSTGAIPANPVEHAILITAIPPSEFWESVTCRAHDARTGDEVGRVTSSHWVASSKRIGGLYGRYLLTCITTQRGSGGGSISNGT